MKRSWIPVPGHRRYEAHPSGIIRETATKTACTLTERSDGYLELSMRDDTGRWLCQLVHRVICLTFRGPPPTPQHEVRHDNGVRPDCRASNVYWATRVRNKQDELRHGTRRRGDRHQRAILSDSEVADIRRLHSSAPSKYGVCKALAARFGVSVATIEGLTNKRKRPDRCPNGHLVTGTDPRTQRPFCQECRRERARVNYHARNARKETVQ
jgi:hypothetical protein